MKKILLSLLSISLGLNSIAQVSSHNVTATIDTNNIAAGFNSTGALFSKDTIPANPINLLTVSQACRVPKAGLAHAIFTANIWAAGKDGGGNLHNSSEMYSSMYHTGPAGLAPQDSSKWDNIWSISRADVLAVKNDFDTHHAITLPVPNSVLTWPAKGNTSATGAGGVALTITQDMAPFYDRNGDGIYNVYDGDYPMVRGDQMLWWINNDGGSLSTNPMGIDRRYSVYEYNSLTDSNLNNTIFLSVTIKNQSVNAYDSVTFGSFVDFDLGCANNDRVGSIPAKNTFFVYNGYVPSGTQANGVTCDEGSVCPTSEVGYGCVNPMMTATFLNNTMKCFNYYTNGAATAMTDPYTDAQYYNYMNGLWNDGSPITSGGNGYGGTTPTAFAFPGNPADGSQWSECNQQTGGAIPAGDRRCIAAIGPFTMAAGDTISFDMAFIFHEGPFDNCPDISDSSTLVQHVDSIRSGYRSEHFSGWYDNSKALAPGFTNVGIHDIPVQQNFTVNPNPSNGSFNIHISDASSAEYTITITDMIGQVVYSGNTQGGTDKSIQLPVAGGVYNVTVEGQNYKSTLRMVVTK